MKDYLEMGGDKKKGHKPKATTEPFDFSKITIPEHRDEAAILADLESRFSTLAKPHICFNIEILRQKSIAAMKSGYAKTRDFALMILKKSLMRFLKFSLKNLKPFVKRVHPKMGVI